MFVIVNDGGVIDDGINTHKPGELVEFDDGEAKRLIDAGKVREIKQEDDMDVDFPGLVKAISTLQPDDPGLWTKGGAPKTEALADILDTEVTARERDAAWEMWQRQRKATGDNG